MTNNVCKSCACARTMLLIDGPITCQYPIGARGRHEAGNRSGLTEAGVKFISYPASYRISLASLRFLATDDDEQRGHDRRRE